jgi:ribonuclease PH
MSRRPESRENHALRPLTFELGLQRHAAGSVLVRQGNTHVLCAVTVEDKVPQHRLSSGGGWLTAEYSMLPGSTQERQRRERPSPSGRTSEIQRLIGRSLRAAVDLDKTGPRTFWIDCDVLQADGGTRCASITGSYVAMALAMRSVFPNRPTLAMPVAAISVGIVQGEVRVDLDHSEDSTAEVDLNYVACTNGIIEVQGTAEGRPFPRARLDEMLDAAQTACARVFEAQRAALGLAP